MTEETPEIQGKLSELPLYSDFQRLGNLLNKAQELAMENNNYNPATLKDFFNVLKEIFKFLYPLVKGGEKAEKMKLHIQEMDNITKRVYWKLSREKDYKAPAEIFNSLDDLHQELLILKQDTNLGIKVKIRMTDRQKLEQSLL